MGRWTALKDKFPRIPIDADYQQKINRVLDSTLGDKRVRDLTDLELSSYYQGLRQTKENLEAQRKVNELELEAVTRLFVDRFEEAGETSKTFEGGLTLALSDEPYPTVKDAEALRRWVTNHNLEAFLTLHPQRLASLVKAAITEGQELPSGVDVFMKVKLSRRGGGSASNS